MSLDPGTITRIAKLARIHVDKAEIPRLQNELNGILGWIEQLLEAQVDGVAPMSGGNPPQPISVSVSDRGNPADATGLAGHAPANLRQDIVTDGAMPDAILANAPDRVGEFFTVPKVVE